MRSASTPIVAVRPTAAGCSASAIQRVLCPLDYTPECADALRIAAALAPGARLYLVKLDEGENAPHTSDKLMRLRRWLPPELVDRCELKLVAELTAESLTKIAATTGIDLIATGASPGHGIGDLLRGTITERIVQHSECPVLAVSAQAVRTLPAETGEEVLVGASHGCCGE